MPSSPAPCPLVAVSPPGSFRCPRRCRAATQPCPAFHTTTGTSDATTANDPAPIAAQPLGPSAGRRREITRNTTSDAGRKSAVYFIRNDTPIASPHAAPSATRPRAPHPTPGHHSPRSVSTISTAATAHAATNGPSIVISIASACSTGALAPASAPYSAPFRSRG